MSDERLRFIPGDSPGTIRYIRGNPVKTSDTPPIGIDRFPSDEHQTDSFPSQVGSFLEQKDQGGVKEASVRSLKKNLPPSAKYFPTFPDDLSSSASFGETLESLRQKSGRSRYRLADYSGLSQPYLLRLERGERRNPSRNVVLLLGLGLVKGSEAMDIWDIDTLLLSAGYAPLLRRGEIGSTPA